MKPKIEDTDIIIRRAANGWIVFSGSEYEEDHFITTVYEEGETEWGEHEALIHLFHDHFPGYIQSKNTGGIRLEVTSPGIDFPMTSLFQYESNAGRQGRNYHELDGIPNPAEGRVVSAEKSVVTIENKKGLLLFRFGDIEKGLIVIR